MLSENIRTIRKSKGLSQEELAVKLNVVRQTISKWEQGLSVPDANMLISLAQALDTTVSVVLGETVRQAEVNDLKVISEKLEIINLQLARSRQARRKKATVFFGLTAAVVLAVFAFLIRFDSAYLSWDYSAPEIAVVGVLLHAFEWFFVRLAPVALLGAIAGIYLTWRKK